MPSDFTPAPEELQRLADEISMLRRDFQTGIASLARIEKRLKLAFDGYVPKKTVRTSSGSRPASSKSREELMSTFETVLAATRDRGDVGFESAISNLSDEDVVGMAYELGAGSQKSSVKKAREGVRKRVQESLLLSVRRQPASPPLESDRPPQT
jgi:hypothetical protein